MYRKVVDPRAFLSQEDNLIGIRLIGVNDADLVIGEDGVAARQFNFRHVAADAIVFRHGAMLGYHGCNRGRARDRRRAMTCQALSVVIRGIIANQVAMRIMTCSTTDTRIGAIEAFAIRQAIGLKTDVQFAPSPRPDDRFPRTMTAAAKG